MLTQPTGGIDLRVILQQQCSFMSWDFAITLADQWTHRAESDCYSFACQLFVDRKRQCDLELGRRFDALKVVRPLIADDTVIRHCNGIGRQLVAILSRERSADVSRYFSDPYCGDWFPTIQAPKRRTWWKWLLDAIRTIDSWI